MAKSRKSDTNYPIEIGYLPNDENVIKRPILIDYTPTQTETVQLNRLKKQAKSGADSAGFQLYGIIVRMPVADQTSEIYYGARGAHASRFLEISQATLTSKHFASPAGQGCVLHEMDHLKHNDGLVHHSLQLLSDNAREVMTIAQNARLHPRAFKQIAEQEFGSVAAFEEVAASLEKVIPPIAQKFRQWNSGDLNYNSLSDFEKIGERVADAWHKEPQEVMTLEPLFPPEKQMGLEGDKLWHMHEFLDGAAEETQEDSKVNAMADRLQPHFKKLAHDIIKGKMVHGYAAEFRCDEAALSAPKPEEYMRYIETEGDKKNNDSDIMSQDYHPTGVARVQRMQRILAERKPDTSMVGQVALKQPDDSVSFP